MVIMDLKTARAFKKMTQYELAKKVGISQPLVSNIEKGIVVPSQELKKKIEQVLEVKIKFKE